MDPNEVLQALIGLDRLENEFKKLGPRSARYAEVEKEIATMRTKLPPYILNHHNRIRSRGRNSTAPVRDWVCRSCFISVPIGMRSKLVTRNDIVYCENCGATIYIPTEAEEVRLKEMEETAQKAQQQVARKAAAEESARKAEEARKLAESKKKKPVRTTAKKAVKKVVKIVRKAVKKAVKKTVKKKVPAKKAVKKAARKKA